MKNAKGIVPLRGLFHSNLDFQLFGQQAYLWAVSSFCFASQHSFLRPAAKALFNVESLAMECPFRHLRFLKLVQKMLPKIFTNVLVIT